MSKLFCDAVHCGNNHGRLCCLEQIEVRGEGADTGADTCCGSFIEGENAYVSAFADVSASPETQIGCTARPCLYNEQGVCGAQQVKIEGSYAHRMGSTFCVSFRPGD